MKWSLPKLLYIFARYSSLFYLLYAEVSLHVPLGSVDLIFVLRVCALYGNSKGIIFCLTALFIGAEKY
ncbi:hypothetical protein BDQ17DRAFT_1375927 [Cyathus striatus]|nr:hypothetical protein BDQ17DRAFT_1375927 [Cyathus striatus]